MASYKDRLAQFENANNPNKKITGYKTETRRVQGNRNVPQYTKQVQVPIYEDVQPKQEAPAPAPAPAPVAPAAPAPTPFDERLKSIQDADPVKEEPKDNGMADLLGLLISSMKDTTQANKTLYASPTRVGEASNPLAITPAKSTAETNQLKKKGTGQFNRELRISNLNIT